jgi:CheY-like chemotaxis protein/HPt (histidine-containing phosphotransfer) domain-containing protein
LVFLLWEFLALPDVWQGCVADIVDDGVEAVAACKRQRYDFVLMDVSMPRLDGVDATKQIRALSDNESVSAAVPIIGLTAFAFSNEVSRFRDAGMCAVISKPVQRDALYAAIEQVLQGDRFQATGSGADAELPGGSIETLNNLTRGFSDQQIIEIVTQVSSDLDKFRNDAIRNANDGNFLELGRACHAIRGLASSFGSRTLAELAFTIEEYARSDDGEMAFATTLSSLNSATDSALAAFRNHVDSYTAKQDAR